MIDLAQMKDGPFHGKCFPVDPSTQTLTIPEQVHPMKVESMDFVYEFDEWGIDTRLKFIEHKYHRIPGTTTFEWESDQPTIKLYEPV